MMKPAQPPHRGLSHLLLLIIRTIEKDGAGGTEDLQVTKRELASYGKYVGLTDRNQKCS